MSYEGSCHCGQIKFSVEGEFDSAIECNCSHCSRKGYLLWFVPRTQFTLNTPEGDVSTYTFNKHVIKHNFCPTCGCAPFGFGEAKGTKMAAINVRCLEGVELADVKRTPMDGRAV